MESLFGKIRQLASARMMRRYYTKFKIITRPLDWQMYNVTMHFPTWRERKLTQHSDKSSLLMLCYYNEVSLQGKERICRTAVRFSSRCETVKVFQERAEQLVLILRVCDSGVISMTLPYGKRQLSFFFCVCGGV